MVIVDSAKRFIIFVSSYLGGITALCYTMGFLAETSRWIRLGVPELELASKQYLVTGAKFFGFLLPNLIDGCIVLLERYGWLVLLLLILIGISIWCWKKLNVKQGILLVGEIFLLVLLLCFLRYTPDSFLGPKKEDAYHLSVSTTDLLFKDYLPPSIEKLEDNYMLLVALFSMFSAGTLFFLLIQRRQKNSEALQSTEPFQRLTNQPSSKKRRGSVWLSHRAKRFWHNLTFYSRSWRIIHGFLLFWICFFIVIDLFLLPMNYANTLIYKEFPVVKVRFTADVFPDVKSVPELKLLRREKDNLLFHVVHSTEDSKKASEGGGDLIREIWSVKEEHIKELRVLRNESVWASRIQTNLKPVQPTQ